MKNIESKVSISGFDEITPLLRKMGAKPNGTLKQVDTYYECISGRLKIREINNRRFELIFYERPNKCSSRMSNYCLIRIAHEQLRAMKYVLGKTVGEKIVVKKERRVWLYRNTRIHLDTVKNLGTFLELETAANRGHINKARMEYNEVSGFLGLSRFKKLGESYGDMLLRKARS